MNRPRNRQPRPPRDTSSAYNSGSRQNTSRGSASYQRNVPTIQQVVPGAAVSIVLKADQPTGREVQGIVQDLLTRGNHPRGIKVRLNDGRVGRVQRMAGQPTSAGIPQNSTSTGQSSTDYRSDDQYLSGPPPRSLADFVPELRTEVLEASISPQLPTFSTATSRCPICENFEGDEIAVTRHVEEHLR